MTHLKSKMLNTPRKMTFLTSHVLKARRTNDTFDIKYVKNTAQCDIPDITHNTSYNDIPDIKYLKHMS